MRNTGQKPQADPQLFSVGTPPITVALRRLGSARRLTLRWRASDGTASLTVPPHTPVKEIEHFLDAHEPWLRTRQLARPTITVRAGADLLVDGHVRRLELVAKGPTALSDATLQLVAKPEAAGAAAREFLRQRARDNLTGFAQDAAARFGKTPSAIVFRDTSSRWGSCSSTGRLMFSWRLAMAPVSVQRYVAIHEAAHLVEMNHSRAFWALVERDCANWRQERDWLRANGSALLAVRFDTAP